MAHTIADKQRLLQRVKEIRGQVEAIERGLEREHESTAILHTIVAARGAMNTLMVEVIEGHIREHVLDASHDRTPEQAEAAEAVIQIVRSYLR